MAAKEEWHYAKDGQQFGPISAADLKRLASAGELSATDLVWKDGMADWKKAASIKGLFSTEPSATPTPPPVPKSANDSPDPNGKSPKANVAEAVKSDLNDIVGAAKKAKDLTVAHARKTQISQMSLPNAYFSLGKDVFANERFRDEFSDLFGKIAAKNDEITKIKTSAEERPPATDLKGKLKSGANQLMATGQATKLGFQRDSLIRALGKKSFESHGDSAGPQQLVSPIQNAIEELVRLEEQIKSLPSSKRIPIWQRVPIAAMLTVCCFPVGLALVWFNPRLSRGSKAIWIGGFVAFFVCMMAISQVVVQKVKREVAAAHQLWSSGDEQAAISKYRVLIQEDLHIIPESDRSLILGRVIDFDADSGNDAEVEELLKKADEERLIPTISSEKARFLQEKLKVERKSITETASTTTKATKFGPSHSSQKITALSAQMYNRILAAIEAQDADKLAELLKQADGYSLFTRTEVSALSRPQPSTGRLLKPPPTKDVTYYRDSGESEIDWGQFCKKGDTNEYKTIQFYGKNWGKTRDSIQRIVFHTNGIDTAISIDSESNRITYVHCERPGKSQKVMVPDTRKEWNPSRNTYEMREFIRNETFTPSSAKIYQIIFDKDSGQIRINRGKWD